MEIRDNVGGGGRGGQLKLNSEFIQKIVLSL